MAFTEFDRAMMRRALALAEQGRGYVSPNPLVGCVIVNSEGEVMGEGLHLRFGGPHAEANAVADAEAKGHSLSGATVYVTLEPHAHESKTPPCTKVLIEKGIAKCVVAMEDPNPKVSGAGIRELGAAGIEVQAGLLEAEARELNRFFIKHISTGVPFVTLKLGLSIDGRSALGNGTSKWITSEASRAKVHELRAEHDAVLVGTRTASMDDPALTVRFVNGRQPLRIVLDARLELRRSLKLFSDEHASRTIVLTSATAAEKDGAWFRERNIELIEVEKIDGAIDLKGSLARLGARGVGSVLVESGGTLAASFVKERLFDELIVFYGPLVLGSDALPAVGPLHLTDLSHGARLSLFHFERMEGTDDLMMRFRPSKNS